MVEVTSSEATAPGITGLAIRLNVGRKDSNPGKVGTWSKDPPIRTSPATRLFSVLGIVQGLDCLIITDYVCLNPQAP